MAKEIIITNGKFRKNPHTGYKFVCDTRRPSITTEDGKNYGKDDGRYFRSYERRRLDKDGFYTENWRVPKVNRCSKCGLGFLTVVDHKKNCHICSPKRFKISNEAKEALLKEDLKICTAKSEIKVATGCDDKPQTITNFGVKNYKDNSKTQLRSYCKKCSDMDRWVNSLKKYHITPEQYEALVEHFGDQCHICGTKEKTGRNKRWAVDHRHHKDPKQEYVRGLLCGSCNQTLGYAYDDIERLENAAAYLRKDKIKSELRDKLGLPVQGLYVLVGDLEKDEELILKKL